MKIYVVYDASQESTFHRYIDSYWVSYDNAVERFKKIWIYCREPDEIDIGYYISAIETED